MLPDGRRLGAHLPLGGGMVAAVDRAQVIGLDTLQIFSDNPTAWRRRAEPPSELAAFRSRLDETGMGPVAIHAPYLLNLAGPDEPFYVKSVDGLRHELTVAPAFGARFVNVHTGSHKGSGAEAGIARIADGIATALDQVTDGPDAAVVVLENSAGAATGWASMSPRWRRCSRRSLPGASPPAASRSASTRPTCGAPAIRSTRPRASTGSSPSSTTGSAWLAWR